MLEKIIKEQTQYDTMGPGTIDEGEQIKLQENQELNKKMLKSIYVKNTCFQINDGELIQTEEVPEEAESLYAKVPKFKSGQVFEVIL
mgnify:CR=1 FL=1